jgi:AraC-like DNA-binding protein
MGDSGSGLSFNSNALPERDRFPAFCEEVFRGIIGSDVVDVGTASFHAALEIRRAGAIGIARIATTPVDVIRKLRHVNDGNEDIVVQLWRRGAAHIVQGRRECSVKAGECVILDNLNIGNLRQTETSQFWSLSIPRDRIASLTPNVASFAGLRVTNDPALRLLFEYLEGTLALGLGDRRAAQLFGNHLVDVIALALGGESDTRGIQEQSGVRAARLAAIFQAISDQIANPGLSVASVAAKLGITPRYVHVLLEQSGETFSQYVVRKRLEKAGKLLTDDEGQTRKIAAIAFEVGFADLSHFNRVFRRHFGDTPSGVRASATLAEAPR